MIVHLDNGKTILNSDHVIGLRAGSASIHLLTIFMIGGGPISITYDSNDEGIATMQSDIETLSKYLGSGTSNPPFNKLET